MTEVLGRVYKTNRKSLDIGEGFRVLRHGMDANGNHCVWVSKGAERARKIQTNGNLPTVHSSLKGDGAITTQGADEIKDYYRRFMQRRR